MSVLPAFGPPGGASALSTGGVVVGIAPGVPSAIGWPCGYPGCCICGAGAFAARCGNAAAYASRAEPVLAGTRSESVMLIVASFAAAGAAAIGGWLAVGARPLPIIGGDEPCV